MREERQNPLLGVIETYLNGNITLALRYKNVPYNGSQIVEACELFGLREAINILKKFQYSDNRILNAFHNYNRVQFDEVKLILSNNFYRD